MSTRTPQGGMNALLNSEQVRRALTREGRTLYAAADVVAALTGSRQPGQYWSELKQREPALAGLSQAITFTPADAGDGAGVGAPNGAAEGSEAVTVDALDMEGVLRLVQSVPTARAERLRRWLAATARERLEEETNPELAVMRTRRLYESKGYSRRWVDKRLRGVSARHELTGEWFKRGATESDQYRALTNALMQGAFGMEVEQYRRHKNLFKTGENLRDHMSDLELALTALGETVAVALHRDHDSRGYDALDADARSAGEIVAKTRQEIEARTGREVVESGNHRGWWAGSRRRRTSGENPGARGVAGPVAAQVSGSPDVQSHMFASHPGQDGSEGGKDTSPDAGPTGATQKAVA